MKFFGGLKKATLIIKIMFLLLSLPGIALSAPQTDLELVREGDQPHAGILGDSKGLKTIPCILKNTYKASHFVLVVIRPSMKDGTELGESSYHAYVNPALFCPAWSWTGIYEGIRNSPGMVPGMSKAYFSENKSIAVRANWNHNTSIATPGEASGGPIGRKYFTDEMITLTFYKYGTPKSSLDDRVCFHHWYSNITGFSSYCANIRVRVDIPTCSADASSLTLDLGPTPIAAMPSLGSNSGQIYPKNIHLWCEKEPEIYAQFDGNTVPDRNDIFELNHSGQYAKGIGVQLLWNTIPMQKGSTYRLKSRSDAFEAYIPFSARYIRYQQQTTPGVANATIRATFTYQ